MYSGGTRSLSYRLDILDGEIKIGELPAKEVSINFDGTAADVKMSMTGTSRASAAIDWYKHRLRPVLIDDGQEYPLGTYLPQYVQDTTDGGETLKKFEAYDLSILAKNDKLTERLNLKSGTLYLTAIQGVLISCGVTKIVADTSDAVLQSDRDDWDVGTSKIEIVNQLLSEMSFNDMYVDLNGTTRLTRYETPSASNIDHIYQSGQASIIEPGTSVESNFFEIPNIWIAVVSNPDLPEALVATFTNDNPMSKTSTVYTGQRKVEVLTFDNIATQTDLQNAVNKAAFEAMQGIETISFKTAVEANHGLFDTCAIDIPEYNGITSEISWEIDLDSTSMTHKAKKLVNL